MSTSHNLKTAGSRLQWSIPPQSASHVTRHAEIKCTKCHQSLPGHAYDWLFCNPGGNTYCMRDRKIDVIAAPPEKSFVCVWRNQAGERKIGCIAGQQGVTNLADELLQSDECSGFEPVSQWTKEEIEIVRVNLDVPDRYTSKILAWVTAEESLFSSVLVFQDKNDRIDPKTSEVIVGGKKDIGPMGLEELKGAIGFP